MSDWFLSTLTAEQRARTLQNLERYRDASAGLFLDLSALGYEVSRLSSLGEAVTDDSPAVHVLWRWYVRSDYPPLRRDILSILGEKWARESAMPLLIGDFAKFEGSDDPDGIGFALGDAIGRQVVAENLDDVRSLVVDQRKGVARASIVSAMGSVRKRRGNVQPVLVSLLRDPTVAAFAAEALGRLKALEALPELEECARAHQDEEARKAAKLAVARLSKS